MIVVSLINDAHAALREHCFDPITAYDLADYYPHVLNLALLASQRPAIERFSLPIRSGVPKAKCEGS